VQIFKALCELLTPIGEARLIRRKQRKQKIKANEQLPSSPTVITGFNEITRSLERKDPDDSDAIVFVCRSDTELPQLCSYYPQLCALAGRKLVPLQKGSETALAGVLGLKRVMGVQVKVWRYGESLPNVDDFVDKLCSLLLGLWRCLGPSNETDRCDPNAKRTMART
jgi:RNase P subunit Pop3